MRLDLAIQTWSPLHQSGVIASRSDEELNKGETFEGSFVLKSVWGK
jgi:hypothetical protein